MRLTPKEAKRQVDAQPVPNRQHEAAVSQAIGEATQTGQDFLSTQTAELNEHLTDAQKDAAVEVRDGLGELVRQGSTQAISFADYSRRYDELTDQLAALERERDEIDRRLVSLEAIEADPAEFTDELYKRFPALRRPDFNL